MGRSTLPRHTFNLVTGVTSGVYLVFHVWGWACSPLMTSVCIVMLLTTIVFHGAHCLGHERWADRVFMKYDFGAIVATTFAILHTTPADAHAGIIGGVAFAFGLWLTTFSERLLKGLPYNPIQCLMHILGTAIHLYGAASSANECCDVAPVLPSD